MRRLYVQPNGLWLSRPGIDVWDAVFGGLDSSYFLVSPNYKNEQVVKSGVIAIQASSSTTEFYDVAYTTPPHVFFQPQLGGGVFQIPFFSVGNLMSITVVPLTYGFSATNFSAFVVYITYIAISRTIP